jgi:hypothetical protein
MAMIMALFFAVFVAGLVLSGTLLLTASANTTETGFRLHGQARQFARSGLTDALAWYRRQPSQPVAAFNPVLDLAASPPIIDTDDPAVGIVRQFEINGNLHGRYEVRKTEVRDISAERGTPGVGIVWLIKAWGYVYRVYDETKAFDEVPNQVLGVDVMEAEVRRMTLAPPGNAALCVRTGANVTIGDKGALVGGAGAGLYHLTATGSPTFLGGSQVTGSPSVAVVADYDDSTTAVFGVKEDELRSLADDRISDPNFFPSPIPQSALLFVETNLTFDAARPLTGTGIVYVKGNVTIAPNSNSFFSGFLFVDGNLVVGAPATMSGVIVVKGTVSVAGIGDRAEVIYDPGPLDSLRLEMGQYRLFGTYRNSVVRD